jgi:hypothetical protein
MSDDLLESLKRTLVPIGVGLVVASVVGPYVDESALRDLLAGLIAAGYYSALRFVEIRWPSAGVLLGSVKKPHYE